jgi:inner membrane transporter RhtA
LRVPPVGLVLIAILGFQLGTVLSKPAIESIGVINSAFVRSALGAILLLAWTRPSIASVRQNARLVFFSGTMMIAINVMMFAAIQRIPVGIAIAIEFWGPMMLAIAGTRRARDLMWIALAIAGILLFTPLSNASFDTVGILFAIASGAGFAGALVYSSRLGHKVGGIPAAGLSMLFSAVVLAPFSFGNGLIGAISVGVIARLVLVAVLTNVIGYSLEFTALTRMRPSLYAILICLEPAAGAILAFLLLHEHIGRIGTLGILAVTTASIGSTIFSSGKDA